MPRFLMLPATCREDETLAIALVQLDDEGAPVGLKEARRAFDAARVAMGLDSYSRESVQELSVRAVVRWYSELCEIDEVRALVFDMSSEESTRTLDEAPTWMDDGMFQSENDCLVVFSGAYYWCADEKKTDARYETTVVWDNGAP